MSTGTLQPLNSPGSLILLTEESQTSIYTGLHRKAAFAAGIEALALRAIETGEQAPLEHIADIAGALKDELAQLASTVLQLKAAKV
ncbi:hypothetical protein [Azotobacter beijerinckii]|uniref:DUF3077 domain-containing protein n=1 Tax=Azotobacter beijerinckii TaxID=170623 RepID=A0A1I1B8Y7_9GAMM|nr:hypothetical protein [Azotobacter beijerinckii]SFB46242.1 hypothetical protein SAMN04244571_02987 [Azotobacter beijerinckii]